MFVLNYFSRFFLVKTNTVAFVILSIFAILAFWNVVHGPFIFDDLQLVATNDYVKNPSLKMFTSDARGGVYMVSNMYRPLSTLGYAIIYKVFELDYRAYHVVNILIHLFSSFFLYRFLLLFALRPVIALCGAVIFLIHPVQLETVSYISGLPDLISHFCVLLSMYFYMSFDCRLSYKRILAISILFLLGIFSKEVAIVLPALLFCLFLFRNDLTRVSVLRFGILLSHVLLVALFYMVVRAHVLGLNTVYTGLVMPVAERYNVLVGLNTAFHYFFDYVRLLFFPVDLHVDKSFISYPFLNFQSVLGMIFVAEMILLLVFSFFRKKILFVGFSLFFVSMILYSGVIPTNAPYMEHWLYLPLVGLLIPFCFFIEGIYKKFKICFFVLFILCCTLFLIRDYHRNIEWSHEDKFYINELKYSPYSSKLYSNLGGYYYVHDEPMLSLTLYLLALNFDPSEVTYLSLGSVYYSIGDFEQGTRAILHALELNPNLLPAYNNLLMMAEFTHQSSQFVDIVNDYKNRVSVGERLIVIDIMKIRSLLK